MVFILNVIYAIEEAFPVFAFDILQPSKLNMQPIISGSNLDKIMAFYLCKIADSCIKLSLKKPLS